MATATEILVNAQDAWETQYDVKLADALEAELAGEVAVGTVAALRADHAIIVNCWAVSIAGAAHGTLDN